MEMDGDRVVEHQRRCIEHVDGRLEKYSILLDGLAEVLPDFISASLPYDSDLPVALVCLRDSQGALGQCLHALHQYCLQGCAHRYGEPRQEMMGAWVERFYVEDASMRLYSAAEHAANGIAFLTGVRQDELLQQRGRSQWERTRRALKASGREGPLREVMEATRRNKKWKFTMAYRGRVVHDQPPNLDGLGIQYRRRRHWSTAADGSRILQIRAKGDSPEHSPEEVRECVLGAFATFVKVPLAMKEHIFAMLRAAGIRFDGEGRVSLNPFSSA